MSEKGTKKPATKAAAKKGFYIVTPESEGAGLAKEGKYTESQRSSHARQCLQIHSAQSAKR